MIIAMTGEKFHGKDSAAMGLVLLHNFRRTAFADPLKRALMDIYDLDYEQCYGSQEDKERVDPRYGKSARVMMQEFGTEVGRTIYEPTWVEAVFRVDIFRWETTGHYPHYNRDLRMWEWRCERDDYGYTLSHPHTNWVVTDCRFVDEAAAIRARNGYVFGVERPLAKTGVGDSHASETEQKKIRVDRQIRNDGTLEQLHARISNTYTSLPLLGPST